MGCVFCPAMEATAAKEARSLDEELYVEPDALVIQRKGEADDAELM